MAQIAAEQRGGRRAVDVIVAENCHPFLAHDRIGNAQSRLFHARQHMRVGHQPADAGIEKRLGGIGIDTPPRQYAGQKLRQAVALRNGESARLPPRVQTIPPGASAGRSRNVQKEALVGIQRGGRHCH